MKPPIWRWASWLSLGLAGCFHGSMRQTHVRVGSPGRPPSRQVVPVSAKQAYSRLLAATETTNSGTPVGSAASASDSATIQVPLPSLNRISVTSATAECPSCLREECAVPRSAKPESMRLTPQAVPAAEMANVTQMEGMTINSQADSATVRVEIPRPFVPATNATPISQATAKAISRKPMLDDDFFPEDQPAPATDAVRTVSNTKVSQQTPFDEPAESASSRPNSQQEEPSVANELSATAVKESSPQPREVALLVDQLFEDLRQHRLADARKRTEWLKQLVARRSSQTTEAGGTNAEPQRLQNTEQADPIQAIETEDFFDEK